MQNYISPFALLGLSIEQIQDKQQLDLAKKILLAEFDSPNTQSIQIAENSLTKSDILNLFDELSKPEVLKYHVMIKEEPILSAFLEKKGFNPDYDFQNKLDKRYDEKEFIQFISPYFSEACRYTIIESLDNDEPKKLSDLLNEMPLLASDEDANNIWEAVKEYINILIEKINTLQQKLQNSETFEYNDFELLITDKFIVSLNQLPDNIFATARDNYGEALNDLAILLYEEKTKKGTQNAYKILYRIKELICSKELKDAIKENHDLILNEIANKDIGIEKEFNNEVESTRFIKYAISAIGLLYLLLRYYWSYKLQR